MNFEGKIFNIQTDQGEMKMVCLEWTEERRVFSAIDQKGFLDLDWMEFQDQWGLGRIELAELQ